MKRILLTALCVMALTIPIAVQAGPVDWCVLALAEDWQVPSWSMNCFNMSAYDGYEDDDVVMTTPALEADAVEMFNNVIAFQDTEYIEPVDNNGSNTKAANTHHRRADDTPEMPVSFIIRS